MEPKEINLLPCPFCGGTTINVDDEPKHEGWTFLSCLGCYVGFTLREPKADVVKKWNTRTAEGERE